jgi:hypothetical protein
MDRVLLRALICLLVGAAAGCSDDDKGSTEEGVVTDASASDGGGNVKDSGTAPRRDAAPRSSSADSCEDLECTAPAICTETDGSARCSCPDGYEDKNGDGSECEQTEQCTPAQRRECGDKQCIVTADGPECLCMGPAYEPDGDGCKCAENYAESEDGLCLANDGQACEDDLDCVNEHCVAGICCNTGCTNPSEACRATETATCKDGKTCEYPIAEDGESCEDSNACVGGDTCKAGKCESGSDTINCDDGNPCTDDGCDMAVGCKNLNNALACDDNNACTSDDKCAGGSCSGGTPKECAIDAADLCNVPSCDAATGECGKAPVPDGKLCDDASTCTLMDQCVAGSCTGQGSACGPNSTGCTPGTPNVCMCAAGFLDRAGRCVPENDECQQSNPCSADADCLDPSNDANDVTCTCKPGYAGDGRTCNQVDACANNPCGAAGTCTPGAPGQYTCTCGTGYISTGKTCSCDLTGTWALNTKTELRWRDLDGIEDGDDIGQDWAIATLTYDPQGKLHVEWYACGTTTPDLCGVGLLGIVRPESYGQYIMRDTFDQPGPAIVKFDMDMPNAAPGADYVTPELVQLVGIALDDPRGPWPPSRRDVQGTPDFDGSAVNGARWVDSDNDGLVGFTSFTVPPGGIRADGVAPDPLVDFGESSSVCPREGGDEGKNYNWIPSQEGLTVRRLKQVYSASRFISSYVGKVESCDLITGEQQGPGGAQLAFEPAVGGCLRVDGDGEIACASGAVDFLENSSSGQEVIGAKFVLKRVASDFTCAQARAESY